MTLTLEEPLTVCPLPSVVLHVTVVVPTGKKLPDVGVQLTGRSRSKPDSISYAWPTNVTTVPAGSDVSTLAGSDVSTLIGL